MFVPASDVDQNCYSAIGMRLELKPKPDRLVISWVAPHFILGQLSFENCQEHPEGDNDTPSSQSENNMAFEETIK
jgi:hypothetical protein